MQDIDFDEIDRAVNSVSKVSEPTPVPAREAADVSLASRRSSGRFMDVVHPSSDMRPSPRTSLTAPARSLPEEQSDTAAVVSAAPAAPTAIDTTNTSPVVDSSAFHWPDPIDMHNESHPDVEEPVEAAALDSPFLSDAKIEKRPLGAFSAVESAQPLPAPEQVADVPAEPVEAVAEVPSAEASIIKVVDTADAPDVVELAPDPQSLTAVEETPPEEEPTLEVAPTPEEAPLVAAVEDIPLGPTSITQQYKEQPVTDEQQSGAIFDTESYHQALAHPAKKQSAAAVIVWIVLLLLVGGGIGAAVYFFVLPMIG